MSRLTQAIMTGTVPVVLCETTKMEEYLEV